MQMAKMPTEEDGVRPLRGAKMGGNDFGSLPAVNYPWFFVCHFCQCELKRWLSVILNISQQMAKTLGGVGDHSTSFCWCGKSDEAGKFVRSGTGVPRVS